MIQQITELTVFPNRANYISSNAYAKKVSDWLFAQTNFSVELNAVITGMNSFVSDVNTVRNSVNEEANNTKEEIKTLKQQTVIAQNNAQAYKQEAKNAMQVATSVVIPTEATYSRDAIEEMNAGVYALALKNANEILVLKQKNKKLNLGVK